MDEPRDVIPTEEAQKQPARSADELRAAANAAENEYIKKCAEELGQFLKERNLTLTTVQQIFCVDGQPQFGPMNIQLSRPKQQPQ